MLQSCPLPFDEGRMWKGDKGEELKLQLQVRRNRVRAVRCARALAAAAVLGGRGRGKRPACCVWCL